MAVRLKSPLEVAACVAAKEVKCIVMFDREDRGGAFATSR